MIPMWVWFVMPICAVALIAMWFVFGKDKKTIATISVRPPADLDPLEMEFAQIATISDRGIFAMYLYWVSKGILKTRDKGERVAVERVADLPEDAPEHRKFLYEKTFCHGDLVWLDKIPPELSEHKGELCELVSERFKGENSVLEDSSMNPTMAAMAIMIIGIFVVEVTVNVNVILSVLLAILLFCALALLQNGAMGFSSKYDPFEVICGVVGSVGLLLVHSILLMMYAGNVPFTILFAVCYLICTPCVMFMERRANHGLYGQILGFRTFIETAEWERLKTLSEEDPNYGIDLLPYAMLFNMGTAWTKKIENDSIFPTVEKMEEMTED